VPNRRKQKGDRAERYVRDLLNAVPGVHAQRVPLSGAVGGNFSGDLYVITPNNRYTAEVKARANAEGWVSIKSWLNSNDFLFLKEDHEDPLVVIPWRVFEDMLDYAASCVSGSTV